MRLLGARLVPLALVVAVCGDAAGSGGTPSPSAPPANVMVTMADNQNYLLVRGTQAIWLANAVGRSTIKATGGVNCPSGQACPLLLAVFSATIEVAP